MSTVDISDHAMDVAWRAFNETSGEYLDYATALADAMTAAAPLIVSTELRRIADAHDDRANELDPPGGAS